MTTRIVSVEQGWAGIEAALADSSPGDEVHLGAGRFEGERSLSIPTGVLLSGEGRETVLVNTGTEPVIHIASGNVVVSTLRFVAANRYPCAILVKECQDVRVVDCFFDGTGIGEGGVLVLSSNTVTVRACHFCDNHVGVLFSSSTGRIIDNECSQSRSGPTILVVANRAAGGPPSDVVVEGNRCFNTEFAGIGFQSSHGRIRQNECWGSRSGPGILIVGSSDKDIYEPSIVIAEGNRCHENKQTGIAVLSSKAVLKDNDCWGSRIDGGIVIQRDENADAPAADVTAEGNRCHENEQAGIAVVSSKALLKDNDCWGNRIGNGILITRHENADAQPSDVTAEGNRCHENKEAGIAFFASKGTADANVCWGNGTDDIDRPDSAEVSVSNHRTTPDDTEAERLASRRTTKPLGAWLLDITTADQTIDALADFLTSGGCRDCFGRFWSGGVQDSVLAGNDAPPTSATRRVYRVLEKDDRTHIRALPDQDWAWEKQPVAGPGLPSLRALLAGFGRKAADCVRKKTRSGDAYGVRYNIALVTADETGFDEWLKSEQALKQDILVATGDGGRRLAIGKPIQLDLERDWVEMSKEGESSGFIEEQLIGSGSWLKRHLGERLFAILSLPIHELLLLLAGEALLFFAVVRVAFDLAALGMTCPQIPRGLGWLGDLGLWLGSLAATPFVGSEVVASAGSGLVNLAQGGVGWCTWMSATQLVLFGPALKGLIAGMLMLTLFNRTQPGPLRITPKPLVDALANATVSKGLLMGPFVWVAKFGWWQHVIHSAGARRSWIRAKIFGLRFLGVPIGRQTNVAIVVLRNADVVTPAQAADLRLLMELCPPRRSILVVTHMTGLSMLVSGYLDVWFAVADTESGESFVVHDPVSARVSQDQKTHEAAAPSTETRRKANRRLQEFLGWPADRAVEEFANELIEDGWGLNELLPMLVLGSTPQVHMNVRRLLQTDASRWDKQFLEEVRPYAEVMLRHSKPDMMDNFNSKGISDVGVERAEQCIGRSRALRRGTSASKYWFWVGRVGYRRELALVMRDLFDTGNTCCTCNQYLAEMMACGELHHLAAARRDLVGGETSSGSIGRAQRAVLHVEAALFLLQDRLATWNESIQPADAAWQGFREYLRANALVDILDGTSTGRLCTMVIAASKALNEPGSQEAVWFGKSLEDFGAPPDEVSGLWGRFVDDVRSFLLTLANRDPKTADDLIDAKLKQDWYYLPEQPFKAQLREVVKDMPRRCLEGLEQAKTPEELMERLIRLREQPGLVTYGVSMLAEAEARGRLRRGEVTRAEYLNSLTKVADAVLPWREFRAPNEPDIVLPNWRPVTDVPALGHASMLIADPKLQGRLTEALRQGREARARMADLAREATRQIEGIALEVHGQLGAAENEAKRLDAVALWSA